MGWGNDARSGLLRLLGPFESGAERVCEGLVRHFAAELAVLGDGLAWFAGDSGWECAVKTTVPCVCERVGDWCVWP